MNNCIGDFYEMHFLFVRLAASTSGCTLAHARRDRSPAVLYMFVVFSHRYCRIHTAMNRIYFRYL
jgi:hypothetical protein